MTSLTLTSELEAVNTMLGAISESPVASLDAPGLALAAEARAVLNTVSREVQSGAWHFNQEDEYPLYPDISGNINIPANTLEVDEPVSLQGTRDIVQRGTRLYDKKAHSYTFTEPLKVSIKFLLPWDELPQQARNYIMIRASRRFQVREVGSDTQHRFTQDDEDRALVLLQSSELNNADLNMLRDSGETNSILVPYLTWL